MSKKKILFCGEASWLATGFAKYNREIIARLHKTGKYEIAEMGSYGKSDDPNAKKLPWRFYGVLPNNEEEGRIYGSKPVNQFGEYKFDAVVADFQPDIVFDARDPWMFQHIVRSRFRGNFKLVLTPTVDSAPQKIEWVEDIFKKADVVTTYSEYAKHVLEDDGVNVLDVTSPGVDLDIFKPRDRIASRDSWPLPLGKKLLVIGTVMRNQKRKCFPDLFESYAELRKKYKGVVEVERSVLLCHTSWPDVGWDIPELVKRSGIQRHVIFTYKCGSCNCVFLSWILPTGPDGNGRCVSCGNMTARMPSTHNGITEEELATVYNCMDIYVQPSICEGWGLPIVEAKACGVPGLYSNYSAMEDHVNNGGGMAIDVGRFYTEAETMALRALPDKDDFVNKMKLLLSKSKKRRRLGKRARRCAEKMHDWQITADKFEKIFDDIEVSDRGSTWNKRPEIKIINRSPIPPNLTNEQFVLFCYKVILGREPDQAGFNNWMKNLATGGSRDAVEQFFRNENEMHNKFEEIRFKKSLIARGFDVTQGIQMPSNVVPGIIV